MKYLRIVVAIEDDKVDEFLEKFEILTEEDGLLPFVNSVGDTISDLSIVQGYYVAGPYSNRGMALYGEWRDYHGGFVVP